jgi:hypothetical protein
VVDRSVSAISCPEYSGLVSNSKGCLGSQWQWREEAAEVNSRGAKQSVAATGKRWLGWPSRKWLTAFDGQRRAVTGTYTDMNSAKCWSRI